MLKVHRAIKSPHGIHPEITNTTRSSACGFSFSHEYLFTIFPIGQITLKLNIYKYFIFGQITW